MGEDGFSYEFRGMHALSQPRQGVGTQPIAQTMEIFLRYTAFITSSTVVTPSSTFSAASSR